MEKICMDTESREKNKPHKFFLNISQRLELKTLYKYVSPQNLSICYMWKYTRKQCKKDKLKIIASTKNDEFELPDGFYSVSDIQD